MAGVGRLQVLNLDHNQVTPALSPSCVALPTLWSAQCIRLYFHNSESLTAVIMYCNNISLVASMCSPLQVHMRAHIRKDFRVQADFLVKEQGGGDGEYLARRIDYVTRSRQ